MEDNCVKFYTDGRSAWKVGLLGFFTRVRGAIPVVALTVLTAGAPWWWPSNIPGVLTIRATYALVTASLIVCVLFAFGFSYLKNRSIRSLDLKHHLHQFAHFLRDEHTGLCARKNARKSRQGGQVPSNRANSHALMVLGNGVCERIRNYFVCLTGDQTVQAAIRVARKRRVKNGASNVVYWTMGRSSGLSSSRQETTEDLPPNEGVPGLFATNGNKGVLMYYDLDQARARNLFSTNLNAERYRDEIKTMMVAPMNAWDGEDEGLIGILFVTSRKKDTFGPKYVDSMRFMADVMATSASLAVGMMCKNCTGTVARD